MSSLSRNRYVNLVSEICRHRVERSRNDFMYKNSELLELLSLSVKNKIPLLYLESIRDLLGKSCKLERAFARFKKSEEIMLLRIREMVGILSKRDIDYAVFKLLSPSLMSEVISTCYFSPI